LGDGKGIWPINKIVSVIHKGSVEDLWGRGIARSDLIKMGHVKYELKVVVVVVPPVDTHELH